MRVYAGIGRSELDQFARHSSVLLEVIVPESDDESDEFAAMEQASQSGPVVVAADVDAADHRIGLEDVAAWHVDVDGSGDLSWYATQELDQVITLLG